MSMFMGRQDKTIACLKLMTIEDIDWGRFSRTLRKRINTKLGQFPSKNTEQFLLIKVLFKRFHF